MRLLVFFDLPSTTPKEKRSASRFRRFLIKQGFSMLQYSVYMRTTRNSSDSNKYLAIVNSKQPKKGDVRFLTISEQQYKMIAHSADPSDFGTDELIEI